MACCAVGVAITAAVVWVVRWVRVRVLGRSPESDPAQWLLDPGPSSQ